MKVFMYVLVIALTVLVTLGCVYGFSCLSCEGCGDETTEEETAEALSVKFLSGGDDDETVPDEDEPAEVKQWVKVTFDVVVIAMTVGVVILVWWAARRVMKRYGGSGRRFG